MRTIAVVILACGIAAGPARAGEYLQTLREGSWVCTSPDAYDGAIAHERRPNENLEDLKKRLLDQKLCIYMDADFVAKIMVPFARVLERQGPRVKVEFTVEFRKRLQTLHRQVSRVTFVGWTDAGNLLDKEIL
jgi:hypothetical protein